MTEDKLRRVAFVSNSARGEYTGRLRWVEPLRARGFDVSFVLPEGDDEYVRRFEDRDIKVFRYSLNRSARLPFTDAFAVVDLIRLFRSETFDIVHSFGNKANVYMGLAAICARSPAAFVHVTGLGFPFMPGGGAGRAILRTFLRCHYQLVALALSGVFFQNQDDKMDLGLWPESKTLYVGATGVDIEHFDPTSISSGDLNTLRRDLGVEGRLVLTYVGRLLKDKGIPELLACVAAIHRDDPRVVLLIVGTPDPGNASSLESDQLVNAKDGSVCYLGRRDDIREILALTDVFVNPSIYREGVPRANLEALAMGKPVVTTNGPGCKDTVRDGETGLIVPQRDRGALEAALRHLIESGDLRARLGRAARDDARARFTVENTVDRVAAAYRATLEPLERA